MAPNPYNPNDTMPDLDGNGGTVGNSGGTPGSGPLEMIQDGDPYSWEVHNIGQGSTQYKHGLFGKLIDGLYYLWRRWNLVESLGGTTQYTSGNFPVGNSLAILSATGNGVSPIVCTVSSTEGMRAGSDVVIAGATGNTAMIGTWRVQIISSTQFSIPATGNGTYNASSATAKWAWSLWQFAMYMSNNAAMTNVANSFGPNQSFASNVVISGNLTVGGAETIPVFAPTEYFAPPVAKQTPAFTGAGNQPWYVGDPGTPIVTGTCDQTLSSIMKFVGWGSGSGSQGLTIYMAAHSGSDSPEVTIVFSPVSANASFQIIDVGGGSAIFGFGAPTVGSTQINAGSVTIYWSNASGGAAWRVKSWTGFEGWTWSASTPVW